MAYQVKLDIFEGPLDLLLFFIQRDEIDIYDIPISRITDQYLGYLDLLIQLNIGVAGEYIRMAATLMRIKARTLLPQLAVTGEDEEIEDPRAELVQMLLEYKQFKEIATDLKVRETEYLQYYQRQPNLRIIDTDVSPDEVLNDVTIYDLMHTFQELLKNIPEPVTHNIKRIDVTIRQQSRYIVSLLQGKSSVYFSEIMQDLQSKIVVIVTFIALLDMIKNRRVNIFQNEVFDDFRIEMKNETVKA